MHSPSPQRKSATEDNDIDSALKLGTDRLNIFPPTRFSTSLSLYRPAPFTIPPLSVGTSVFTALCFQRLSDISHKGCFHSLMANHMSQGLQQNFNVTTQHNNTSLQLIVLPSAYFNQGLLCTKRLAYQLASLPLFVSVLFYYKLCRPIHIFLLQTA